MKLRRFSAGIALFCCVCVAGTARAQEPVDVALVLAVDVSGSMGQEELRQQRAGYVAAFRSPDVVSAIREGKHGRVAVTYVEWARADQKHVIVPWTVIDGREAAEAFAAILAAASIHNMRRTSISGAIKWSVAAFGGIDVLADRRVIDISGDGPNNDGGPVTAARDAAVEEGIAINGLPLLIQPWYPGIPLGAPDLSVYYRQCVVGGPNSFVVPVHSWEEFPAAVRHKLALELAGTPVAVIRAAGENLFAAPTADCLIGEKVRSDFERRYP